MVRTVLSDLPPDVPSRVDLRQWDDAQTWASVAIQRRPWREEFFQAIVHELGFLKQNELSILELGSGPGFLALRVLENVPTATYVALDFSPAMHSLARQRLGSLAQRVNFLEVDFKRSDWVVGLHSFDAVLTVQAIHELRHKCHAPAIYRSIRLLLNKGGIFLVCDHFVGDGGMRDSNLYMTVGEHDQALRQAGFKRVEKRLETGGLVLFLAA